MVALMPRLLHKMHILHLGSEKGWRGGENQIRLLIEGLQSEGLQNSLAYPKGSRAIEVFKSFTSVVELTSSNPFSPQSLKRLIKYCRDKRVTIIDAHSSKAHQLALNLKFFLPELKLVVHRRVDNIPSSSWWTKRRYHSPRVNQFVAISHKIESILLEYGVEAERLTTIHSAIDVDKYRALSHQSEKEKLIEKYKLPQNCFLLGNASALSSQKGYETLIDALALIAENPQWHCLIAGEGDLKESLIARVKKFGLEERIQFIGFIDFVPHFLSGLDLVCVPSNNEGLGTLILDAMAAGTPVIACAVGGIPEIIDNEVNGLLVDKGDSKALAQRIEYLMDDEDHRIQLRHHAYEKLSKHFSLSAMVSKNRKVYSCL